MVNLKKKVEGRGRLKVELPNCNEIVIEDDESASYKDTEMKKRQGDLFSSLYATLYGGFSVWEENESDIKRAYRKALGVSAEIRPDVTLYRPEGSVWTEVKSLSVRDRRPLISLTQASNYSFLMHVASYFGKDSPEVDIAIFTYGVNGETDFGFSHLDNDDLKERSSKETQNLVILPLNLFFYFLTSRKTSSYLTLNSASSSYAYDENTYRQLQRSTFSNLVRGRYFFDELQEELDKEEVSAKKGKYDGGSLKERFCLGGLSLEESLSSSNVWIPPFKVNPFKIFKFFNKNPGDWASWFYEKRHHVIGSVGINDLFSPWLQKVESGEIVPKLSDFYRFEDEPIMDGKDYPPSESLEDNEKTGLELPY